MSDRPRPGSPTARLFAAVRAADPDAVRRALDDGADVNATDRGDTPLADAVDGLADTRDHPIGLDDWWRAERAGRTADLEAALATGPTEDQARLRTRSMEVIGLLLDHGADPGYHEADGGGPLFEAVLHHEHEVLDLLLRRGADPNFLVDGHESLYDWAEHDYRFDAFGPGVAPTLEWAETDRADEDAWVAYLDRAAARDRVFRPDVLRVLRSHGALTARKMGVEPPPGPVPAAEAPPAPPLPAQRPLDGPADLPRDLPAGLGDRPEMVLAYEYALAWNALDPEPFLTRVHDGVEYESQHVLSAVRGRETFADYLREKMSAVRASPNARVEAEVGLGGPQGGARGGGAVRVLAAHEGRPCVVLHQPPDNPAALVFFEVRDGLCARVDVCGVAPHPSTAERTGVYPGLDQAPG